MSVQRDRLFFVSFCVLEVIIFYYFLHKLFLNDPTLTQLVKKIDADWRTQFKKNLNLSAATCSCRAECLRHAPVKVSPARVTLICICKRKATHIRRNSVKLRQTTVGGRLPSLLWTSTRDVSSGRNCKTKRSLEPKNQMGSKTFWVSAHSATHWWFMCSIDSIKSAKTNFYRRA